ncbi:Uncharacterised protein [Escherichia coli]|uniref:Uncharacterized protein n=1 Tax=Escherichia coli TaxID=562 RepID=A0A2X3KEW7_ECOLX|nr:Uncharacterised protein [Escherichia coli]
MEQLRAELSHLLGEKLSRIECVNEKADTALWALYDSQGNPMPLMARSFSTPGKADNWHGKPPCWQEVGLSVCRLFMV